MRVSAICAIAVVLTFAATACAGNVGGTPAVGASAAATGAPATGTTASTTDQSSSTTDAGSSNTDALASGVTIDELADDIDFAQKAVDGFWKAHWSEFFTGEYRPPVVKGLYDGTDPTNTPTCDGEPLEAFNAYYCEDGNYVAWDAGLLLEGADQIGDSWVYLVIAHEWGHAVQARLDPVLVAVELELQADCLGGAALFGAVADKTLELEAGDERELISSLSLLADEMAWTMSSDHGDPFQRVQWFTLGRNGGVNACLDAAQSSDGGSTPSAGATPSAGDAPSSGAATSTASPTG